MIESIQEICALLARSPLTVQEVGAKLGVLVEDQGGSLPLIIRPRYPLFSRAMVTRQFGTQLVAGVILTLAETTELELRLLCATFGTYSLMPMHLSDKAPSVKFYLGEPAEVGSTSIIATLMPGQWDEIEDGVVSELTLQPEF